MYQDTTGRLLNHSESCQVYKVASLLTEALNRYDRRAQFGDAHPDHDCETGLASGDDAIRSCVVQPREEY
jgi:hypothetical protein